MNCVDGGNVHVSTAKPGDRRRLRGELIRADDRYLLAGDADPSHPHLHLWYRGRRSSRSGHERRLGQWHRQLPGDEHPDPPGASSPVAGRRSPATSAGTCTVTATEASGRHVRRRLLTADDRYLRGAPTARRPPTPTCTHPATPQARARSPARHRIAAPWNEYQGDGGAGETSVSSLAPGSPGSVLPTYTPGHGHRGGLHRRHSPRSRTSPCSPGC